MSGNQEITYQLDLRAGTQWPRSAFDSEPPESEASIARIARLMALAIRFERLVGEKRIDDYAQLARLGHVTRARMTQIVKLLDLAPDIQEQLLFLPPRKGLNERNLREIVRHIDWNAQRRMFEKLINHANNLPSPARM
ncbi:MAG TPA: hypothetical protein VH351_15205 [Bryobacteraceae bacterium]|jgi:hypothetical protein|nr:hypothetical protein [Bryobacteraceae bacterium]